MRAEKRFWIYAGLGIPEGVALVRRPHRLSAAERVMLIGSEALQGLGVALARLADDAKSVFHADLRDATLREWAENDWLPNQLSVFRPTAVLVALDPRDSLARQAVHGRIQRSQACDLWLVPPGIPWRATKRYLPAPELNVEGYALWAARAMGMIK